MTHPEAVSHSWVEGMVSVTLAVLCRENKMQKASSTFLHILNDDKKKHAFLNYQQSLSFNFEWWSLSILLYIYNS